jgi:hypothetical protein
VGLVTVALAATGFDSFRTFAHRARCACAIFRREANEITRTGFACDDPEPFNDSMTEIA